jgi:hypothetical protein
MREPLDVPAPENQRTDLSLESRKEQPKPLADRLRNWLRHLLACNPFYLVSVALLLYACYRISIDPKVFNNESAHLFFNFSSLQVYEALVAGTAILLGRRRIWYDSTLLVGLENLLLIAPFILISQAGLIDRKFLWLMCGVAGILAMIRLTSVKAFVANLNFPPRLLLLGSIVLLTNVFLPVIYRNLHENKVGTHLEAGAAYYTNEISWLLILPLLCGMAVLLPKSPAIGELWPQRRWLPLGLFALWIAGTGVHLYCLGYVYDFNLRGALLAPAIWVLMWTLRQRISEIIPAVHLGWQRAMLVLPLLCIFMAYTSGGSTVFLVLSLMNIVFYGCIFHRHREQSLAMHLLLISLATTAMAIPESWRAGTLPAVTRSTLVVGGFGGYGLVWIMLSRNPLLGLVGALIVSSFVPVVMGGSANSLNWAMQAGLAFLLLHSLFWAPKLPGATQLRVIAAAAWIMHTFIWMHFGGEPWMACVAAAFVLAIFLLVRVIKGKWSHMVVPISAIAVILSGPCNSTAGKLHTIPAGIIAMAGSFLLFGLGTAAALTRHRWHGLERS